MGAWTPGTDSTETWDATESRLLADLPASLVRLVLSRGAAVRSTLSVEARPPHRPSLAPQPWTPWPSDIAAGFATWRATATIASPIEVTALEAGVRQFHDDLDGSHQCSQSIEGQGCGHGDYWHAIMHRREPDYVNSQYWFRQVGRHPIFAAVAREAAAVADQSGNPEFAQWQPRIAPSGTWNSLAFVDCVEAAAKSSDDAFRHAVEEVQYREMLLLFAQTYRAAVGIRCLQGLAP